MILMRHQKVGQYSAQLLSNKTQDFGEMFFGWMTNG